MGFFKLLGSKTQTKPLPLKVRVLDGNGTALQDLSLREYGYNTLRWSYDLAVGALDPIANGKLYSAGFVSAETMDEINAARQVYLAQTMGIFCGGYSKYLLPIVSGSSELQKGGFDIGEIDDGILDGANTWFSPAETPHRMDEHRSFLGGFKDCLNWHKTVWLPRMLANNGMPKNEWLSMLNKSHCDQKMDDSIAESDIFMLDTVGILSPTEFLSSARSFFQLVRSSELRK